MMALTSTVNHQGMLMSLKSRAIYKSVENNISRPTKINKTRNFTNTTHFKRGRILRATSALREYTFHGVNVRAVYLQSQLLTSFPRKYSSSNQEKHDESIKNDIFRLSQNETTDVLNKLNARIEERYSEVKEKANVMVNSLKDKVNNSTSSFGPTTLFQLKSNENPHKLVQHNSNHVNETDKKSSSNKETDLTTDSLNSRAVTDELTSFGNNESSENHDEPPSCSEESSGLVKISDKVESKKDSKLNLNKMKMSLPSLEDIKSTSSFKNATSFTETTLKRAAQKTDDMTQDLQGTLTSLKDKISSIPKIDQFTTRFKGSKVKSAAERNRDLPSPQGKVYTLEDTLLKMGEMAGSTVNIVASSPASNASKSEGETTTTKMKKYLEQTVKAVKQQEHTSNNQNEGKSKICKASIDNRTKALSIGVRTAETTAMKLLRVERLAEHLLQYPESRQVAVKVGAIPSLLKMQKTWDRALVEHVHMCLALLGYVPNVRGRGLRVLSIDGGGARGVIPIQVLRELERRTNCRIRDMFDYIMGVSSGGVLAFLLSFGHSTLDECSAIYRRQSLEVFKRNSLVGTGKLFLNHAFYDTEGWANILKTYPMAKERMIEFAKDPTCPKVATVATLINQGALKDYLFRNYNLPAGVSSRYLGSSSYPSWQALRASSAAPGYFEEHKLDDYIFQDGGVLTNNPSALAIHECKLLWPNTPIQCVISLGTGRWDPQGSNVNQGFSTLKEKLVKIMLSATDTQSVHTIMNDLLPPKTYYRFNPFLSEDFDLDENRPEKLNMMEEDIRLYLEENEQKIADSVKALTNKKTPVQKVSDWVKHKKLLYDV
ncbi:calcium-independent phospholipase A2-gamma-like isoform X2 [Antedon mediterranea]